MRIDNSSMRISFGSDTGNIATRSSAINKHMDASFNAMSFFVIVGWSAYTLGPLGYFFGYLVGSVIVLSLVYIIAGLFHRDCRLANLHTWLLLRELHGQCPRHRSQLGLHDCRPRARACISIACQALGFVQIEHHGTTSD